MKQWTLAGTWLASPPLEAEFDEWTRGRMLEHHRQTNPESEARAAEMGPWSVQALVCKVEQFGKAPSPEPSANRPDWIWCISAIAQLYELVFTADDGTIGKSASVPIGGDIEPSLKALGTIRNICFHPGFHRVSNDEPHMLQFCRLENLQGQKLMAVRQRILEGDWADFASRPVAWFALQQLHAAGRLYALALRSRGSAFTSEHCRNELGKWR